jgi:hypothetical protein
MNVSVRLLRCGRDWEATASVPDVFTVRRYGTSQVKAEEHAVSAALRRVYEIMEDGHLCLNDVSTITFTRGDAP